MFGAKKEMIGGPDEDEGSDEEYAEDEGEAMDAEAQKDEAARQICRVLGLSPGAAPKLKRALEAFNYACKE